MQRYSGKRAAILDTLRMTDSHPSAEWIYAKLKPDYPDLSLATVYRNLRGFVEDGNVVSVGVVDAKARYDGDTHPHAHFICENCGMVRDVQLPAAEDLGIDSLAESATGAKVTKHEILFRGLCGNCK